VKKTDKLDRTEEKEIPVLESRHLAERLQEKQTGTHQDIKT
jgi:hypothetical protein